MQMPESLKRELEIIKLKMVATCDLPVNELTIEDLEAIIYARKVLEME